jgi:hypothetical protein
MPLGTGNDLARIFGWSGGVTLDDDAAAAAYLQSLEHSKETLLDRCGLTELSFFIALIIFCISCSCLSPDGRWSVSINSVTPSCTPSAPGSPPPLVRQASASGDEDAFIPEPTRLGSRSFQRAGFGVDGKGGVRQLSMHRKNPLASGACWGFN